jgi:hypothetical protein
MTITERVILAEAIVAVVVFSLIGFLVGVAL